MIQSKHDYYFYLKEDKKALGIKSGYKAFIKNIIAPNYVWSWQKLLRKVEYFKNCRKDVLGKIIYICLKLRFRKKSLLLGFSIPENVFGPGLAIVHYGTIVINKNTKVGKNCRIHASTNIGASSGSKKAPILGDNVYIAPGVKIFGDIELGNNLAIGANSTVNKTIKEDNIVIAGTPAKRIKHIDIKLIMPYLEDQ